MTRPLVYPPLVSHQLIPHPDFPPGAVQSVCVEVDAAGRTWLLGFRVEGAEAVAVPELGSGERTDGLWKTTCFELFVETGGGAYFEFNLSPSTDWAAYGFAGYRAGMRDLSLPAPRIERQIDGVAATLDLSGLPKGDWRVGFSAVIEERDGTISYWALAHPPGKPDFHHGDCFALELAGTLWTHELRHRPPAG